MRTGNRRQLRTSRLRRAAATLAVLSGLGFGTPGLIGLRHFIKTGEVWMCLGFPTYGKGPFEGIGFDTNVPLLSAFLGVCAAEILLGGMIWKGSPTAPGLSYALLPLELTFWTGFGLPFGPVLGLGRVGLLVAARREAADVQGGRGQGS